MVTHFFLGIAYPKQNTFLAQPDLKIVIFRGEKFIGIHTDPKDLIANIHEVKRRAEKLLAHFMIPSPPLYKKISFVIFPDISLGN